MKNLPFLVTIVYISIFLQGASQKVVFNYKTDYPAYLKSSQDPTGNYYYKKLKSKLANADTTLSSKAILHLLIYATSTPDYNPVLLDTLCRRLYDENEKGNYEAAIVLADSILRLTPINLTAVKEKTLSLKKLGRTEDYRKYSVLTRKTMDAFFASGDGRFEHPFFGVNYFDGVTFYGAASSATLASPV